MYLGEAYEVVWRLRREFRSVLERNQENLDGFLNRALAECYGEFDEQTVAENLREEYLLFKEKAA